MQTQTADSQKMMTPQKALKALQEGNERFQKNRQEKRKLLQQVEETSAGQYPYAVVLSCIDSRTSVELTFDQGIGDVFSIRVAGNFANPDILGSMEYACGVAGAKLVLILGHTRCGAVNAACEGDCSGNIATLLESIKPAVVAAKKHYKPSSITADFADQVAKTNVEMTIASIRRDSSLLRKLEQEGTIDLVGAMYDVTSGAVDFFSVPPQDKKNNQSDGANELYDRTTI